MSRHMRFAPVMAVVAASIVMASVAMTANAQKADPDKTVAVEAASQAHDGQCKKPDGQCKESDGQCKESDGQCKAATEKRESGSMMCPMCRMMSGKMAASEKGGMSMDPAAMMQQCMGMMQEAGVPAEMMRRCQVMMKTPIFLDSPCAVFGQAKSLGLSDAQKKQLTEIENDARKKAMAVLTPEQRDKMGKVPTTPMAMAQVCQQICGKMMPMMQKRMGSKEMGKPMMTCPMMQKMGGRKTPEGSGTK